MSLGPRLISDIESLERLGGRLCLDFVNTANWLEGEPCDERLTGPDALAIWAANQGLIAERRLEGDFAGVLEVRSLLRRCLIARPVRAGDLEKLNRIAGRPAALAAGAAGGLRLEPASVEALLALIAGSAAELLLTETGGRLKVCPGERCGWLFLDESPTGRRRWCSMAACGNRAKAKRHYRQRRAVE